MFGENCDLIHQVVFDRKTALSRFKDPKDFTERSLVQLKKKLKKDIDKIDVLLKNKSPDENQEWFEKKYNMTILNFNKAELKEMEDEGIFDDDTSQNSDQEYMIEVKSSSQQSDKPIKAKLITKLKFVKS